MGIGERGREGGDDGIVAINVGSAVVCVGSEVGVGVGKDVGQLIVHAVVKNVVGDFH